MRSILAVFVGGALGTGIRLVLDATIRHTDQEFPLDTLIINVVGSFLLAILVSRLWPIVPDWVRAGLGPGVLGGFTTFSAVMASMVTLAASGQTPLALGYLGLSLVFGFGAAALGLWLGRRRGNSEPTIEVNE